MSVRCYICGKTVDSYYNVRRRDDDDCGTNYLCPDCFERECQNNNAYAREKEELERQIAMVEKQIESAKRAHWMMWDEWERFNRAGDFVSTFCWDRPPAKPINYAEVESLWEKLQDLHNRHYKDNRRYVTSGYNTLCTDAPKNDKRLSKPPRQSASLLPPIDRRIGIIITLEQQKAQQRYARLALEEQAKRKESLQRFLNGNGTKEDVDRVITSLYSFSESEMLQIATSAYSTENVLSKVLDYVGFEEHKKVLIRSRVIQNKNLTTSRLNTLIPKFVCWSDYAAAAKNPNLGAHFRTLINECLNLRDGKINPDKISLDAKQFYLTHLKMFKGHKSETIISKSSTDAVMINAVWNNNFNKEEIRENLISNPCTSAELLYKIVDANYSNKELCQRIYKTPQCRKWSRDYRKKEISNFLGQSFLAILGYSIIIAVIIGAIWGALHLLINVCESLAN